MGNEGSKKGLDEVTKRAVERSGKIAVSGRYNRLPKLLENDYVLNDREVLGRGYNGSVFLARSKTNQQKFAVKGFKLHGVSADKKSELETEAEIFLGMDHPHIARLVDVYECEKYLHLVMECMEGGELFQRVIERKKFPEVHAAEAVQQMLLSLMYLHSHGVVHRDLKLENFLYEKKGSDHLKLIDFGFSHIWEPNTKMAQSCGTLSYVAPDVLAKSYTSQCDLWSLGVIVFILLVGYMPFSGTEESQIKHIMKGKYLIKHDAWAKVTKTAADFVAKLLVVNPLERMTADQALKHQWFTEVRKRSKESGTGQLTEDSNVGQDTVDALVNFAEASQFRKACMSMMAWSLSNEERAMVRDAFLEFDVDRQGTIKLWELEKILRERFDINDDAKLQSIFGALDTSQNEEIMYTEFLAAMVSTRIKMHDDLLETTFRRFDVNNNGLITASDLKEVLGDSFDGAGIDDLIKEADRNNDGQICYDEFLAYIREHTDDLNPKQAEAALKIIDDSQCKDSGRKASMVPRQAQPAAKTVSAGDVSGSVAPVAAKPAQPAASPPQPSPGGNKSSSTCGLL